MLGTGVQHKQQQWIYSPELWAAKTYATARLPDHRLNKRVALIGARLAARPRDSFPQACGGWAETKGLYRMIENERVALEHLVQPLAHSTALEASRYPCVLSVQDTTTLNYTNLKQTKGLGSIGGAQARGLLVHSSIAMREDGVPLGVWGVSIWARRDEHQGRAKRRKERPLEEKESIKWWQGIEQSRAALASLGAHRPRPRLIHVMDREGDIHEILENIADAGEGGVIRCAQDRGIQESLPRAHQAVRNAPLLGVVSIVLERTRTRAPRTAVVQIRSLKMTLKPPRGKQRSRRPVTLSLVEVWEADPPAGEDPLHWLLWTTEEAGELGQALRVVDLYRKRWNIEQIHLVLKSGCGIEELQLESAQRLSKAVALYLPVAVRVVQLRRLVQEDPELPCTAVLHEDEWKALYVYFHQRPVPPRTPTPTLYQAVMWIGRLGGHLGRKRDGLPGVRTLWRGWRDLQMMLPLYRVHPSPP